MTYARQAANIDHVANNYNILRYKSNISLKILACNKMVYYMHLKLENHLLNRVVHSK
jgi:hypothetical protein